MRRDRLIWFAAGAAASGMVAVGASLFIEAPETPRTYLQVFDAPYTPEEIEKLEEVASSSARLLHDCSAKEFLTKQRNGEDGVPYSLLPLTEANVHAANCLLEHADDTHTSLHFETMTNSEAQTH